jgi:hypothetical protein
MIRGGLVLVLVLVSTALVGWATPLVDGVATTDEYAYTYQDEAIGMTLHWQAIDDVMVMCLEAPGTGWVAISFVPTDGTIYADMIIGYVDAETQEAHLSDQAAPSNVHFSHFEDTQLGGEASFIEVAGHEEEGKTVIEFSRSLNTGEDTDVAFADTDLKTMIAFHPYADDLVSYHSQWHDVLSINYITGTVSDGTD